MATKRAKKTLSATQQRKREHLEICRTGEASPAPLGGGFEKFVFVHNALPELDFGEVDTSTVFLGRELRAPVLISSMTGGFRMAGKINRNLAKAAQELGLAMGVGSQRVALEAPLAAGSFRVRDIAPDAFILGNLGAVQLNYGYGIEQCRQAVKMIEADALTLHLNVLQELAQPEGNHNFAGLTQRIGEICAELEVPVMTKEVGSGISGEVAARLAGAGVKAIDVAGVGGTSWYAVESKRAAQDEQGRDHVFDRWGIPTEESLLMVRRAVPKLDVVASGGIRSGLDIAKAVALGANVGGMAQPLLSSASMSADAVMKFLGEVIRQIKIAMMCVGARNIHELRQADILRIAPTGLEPL